MALPGWTALSISRWNIGGPTSIATTMVVAILATTTTELAASSRYGYRIGRLARQLPSALPHPVTNTAHRADEPRLRWIVTQLAT